MEQLINGLGIVALCTLSVLTFGLILYRFVDLCVGKKIDDLFYRVYKIEDKIKKDRQEDMNQRCEMVQEMMKKSQIMKYEQAYQNQLRFEYAKSKEKESINKIVTDKLNEIVKPCAIKK